MNAEQLKSVLRILIKEELKTQLPTLIPQVLTEILSEKTVLSPTPRNQPVATPNKSKEIKKFTNNPALNAVLNETVVKIPIGDGPHVGLSSPISSEFKTGLNISEESSDKIDYSLLNESTDTPSVAQHVAPKNEEQAKVLNILKSDFRGLMKKIDEKKKGGLTNSGMVGLE